MMAMKVIATHRGATGSTSRDAKDRQNNAARRTALALALALASATVVYVPGVAASGATTAGRDDRTAHNRTRRSANDRPDPAPVGVRRLEPTEPTAIAVSRPRRAAG